MPGSVAREIIGAFADYEQAFEAVTRRAKSRFEACDWHGMHRDAGERLDLYQNYVAGIVADLKSQPYIAAIRNDKQFWQPVKQEYTAIIADRADSEIAQSFYNSVTMRVFGVPHVDPAVQYLGEQINPGRLRTEEHECRVYSQHLGMQEVVRGALLDCHFNCPFEDLDRDVALAASEITSYMSCNYRHEEIDRVEIVDAVFYRGKVAYVIGRICAGANRVPLVLALGNSTEGVSVDAVLLTEDEVSIVFSFTRSYFHVDVESPHALVLFLKSIMPLKPDAELYISLGHNKHGKTVLYRDLMRHLEHSTSQFEIARGERGMVMLVFALPSYDVVFKVIKDSFDYPKTTTRQDVRRRYRLVFKHDRGGRLVDAQEFENLRFPRSRFTPELLEALLGAAAHIVKIEGDEVLINHLYTERRLVPMNLYVREQDDETARRAVIDYGQCIKDLAATNIFPGDILLKNFGVTRHGRVVFYDYDELCLLTDCVFREIPQTEAIDDALSPEPWYSVGEQDVFPEELATFMGLPISLRDVFIENHGELFGVDFWADMVARHNAGEVIEIYPYPESKRLVHCAASEV